MSCVLMCNCIGSILHSMWQVSLMIWIYWNYSIKLDWNTQKISRFNASSENLNANEISFNEIIEISHYECTPKCIHSGRKCFPNLPSIPFQLVFPRKSISRQSAHKCISCGLFTTAFYQAEINYVHNFLHSQLSVGFPLPCLR